MNDLVVEPVETEPSVDLVALEPDLLEWAIQLRRETLPVRVAKRAEKIDELRGRCPDPEVWVDEAIAESERGDVLVRRYRESRGLPDVAKDGFIDWPAFWDHDHTEPEWLYPDVLARGRGHAIYSKHGQGKSLFLLWVAARLATGPEKVVVVYLDYEMTEADVYDRLENMGYGPGTDLSRLRYALLPTLTDLDTASGADELMELVDAVQCDWPDHHLFVAFDTMSRAVNGPENDADTYRSFYNHSGLRLKQRGLTWARNDHAGKDVRQGQRGSSGKGDDVDVVWRLQQMSGCITLKCEKRRMPWVPEVVEFTMGEEPLTYTQKEEDWPARTSDVAFVLARLAVPVDASASTALIALREANAGCHKTLVLAAQRWRRLHEGQGS